MWKEIKNYEKETSLFERTDSLKREMHEAIVFFTEKMAEVKSENKELERAVRNIQDLKTMRRDIESELTILQKKKAQIDNFEEDIKQAISLSYQVIEKADGLQELDTKLTGISGDMTHVQSLFSEVIEDSKVLQQQKSDIKQSLEFVSKTDMNMKKLYQRMDDITGLIERVEARTSDLKSYLDDVDNKSMVLTNREREIQDIKNKFDQVEGLMEDMQQRYNSVTGMSQRLEKMKQWMMEAEARLEKLNERASDKIRTFAEFMNAVESSSEEIIKSVNRDSYRNSKKQEYADEEKKQKVILSLYKQRWPVKEIAEKMSVPESEVNFIVNSFSV
jgi:chromosome segregation ATPase